MVSAMREAWMAIARRPLCPNRGAQAFAGGSRFPDRLARRDLRRRLVTLPRPANCRRGASPPLGQSLPFPPQPRSELGTAALAADRF
jgi:hypothetical protein